MEIKLWNNGYVKTISDKLGCEYYQINTNKENRINAVTAIAAISRGKDKSTNPVKRYEHLLKEAAPNIDYYTLTAFSEGDIKIEKAAGRPLEYCPVVLTAVVDLKEIDGSYISYPVIKMSLNGKDKKMGLTEFMNKIGKFSYVDAEQFDLYTIYTNARTLVNAGIPEEDIPFNRFTELLDYFVVEVKTPYFVFAQLRTHGLLSQVAVSERVTEEDEYWLPVDSLDKVKSILTCSYIEDLKLNCVGCDYCKYATRIQKATSIQELAAIFLELPVGKVKDILKTAGYKKEIYNRWPNQMKYKTFIIGGYLNNPYQWGHFLLEREAFENVLKSWVQPTTKETVVAIKELIEKYLKSIDLRFAYDIVSDGTKVMPVITNNIKEKEDGK